MRGGPLGLGLWYPPADSDGERRGLRHADPIKCTVKSQSAVLNLLLRSGVSQASTQAVEITCDVAFEVRRAGNLLYRCAPPSAETKNSARRALLACGGETTLPEKNAEADAPRGAAPLPARRALVVPFAVSIRKKCFVPIAAPRRAPVPAQEHGKPGFQAIALPSCHGTY